MSVALRIGVISDTHGLLRDSALRALAGVDHVIHAGDVGDPQILTELATIAPVTAVRGNVDIEDWANALPVAETLALEGSLLHVLHDLNELDLDPAAAGCRAVVFGHTHKPVSEVRGGILILNPAQFRQCRAEAKIRPGRRYELMRPPASWRLTDLRSIAVSTAATIPTMNPRAVPAPIGPSSTAS